MSACTEASRAHHNHRARRVPERSVSRRRREQNKADLDDNPLNGGWVSRCVNSCTVRRKSVFRLLHLGHSTNTVAANYGSGYALEVMREHMEKVWNALEVTEQKQNKRA